MGFTHCKAQGESHHNINICRSQGVEGGFLNLIVESRKDLTPISKHNVPLTLRSGCKILRSSSSLGGRNIRGFRVYNIAEIKGGIFVGLGFRVFVEIRLPPNVVGNFLKSVLGNATISKHV
jgi:hypothetical protein